MEGADSWRYAPLVHATDDKVLMFLSNLALDGRRYTYN